MYYDLLRSTEKRGENLANKVNEITSNDDFLLYKDNNTSVHAIYSYNNMYGCIPVTTDSFPLLGQAFPHTRPPAVFSPLGGLVAPNTIHSIDDR